MKDLLFDETKRMRPSHHVGHVFYELKENIMRKKKVRQQLLGISSKIEGAFLERLARINWIS